MQVNHSLNAIERLVLQDILNGADPFLGCETTLYRLFICGYIQFVDGSWALTSQGRDACQAARPKHDPYAADMAGDLDAPELPDRFDRIGDVSLV